MAEGAEKTEFRRDEETGLLMAYRNGELVGPIIGTGDFPGPYDLERVRSIVRDIYRAPSWKASTQAGVSLPMGTWSEASARWLLRSGIA